MAGYTPLFGSIITSSIWNEESEIRIVWITMLALANANGKVEGSVSGLAPVARVSLKSCEKAIERLKQPDQHSRTKEFDGRRIKDVDGGWQILNFVKFREKAKKRTAEYYRNYRKQKQKLQTNTNTHTHTQTGATERNTKSVAQQVAFEKFWKAYPRKVGKGKARESFNKVRPDNKLLEKMLLAINEQTKSDQWQKEKGQFIPHPATWLNQERWLDEAGAHTETIQEQSERLREAGEL